MRCTFVKKIGSPKLVKGLPKCLATTSNASPVALDVLTFNNWHLVKTASRSKSTEKLNEKTWQNIEN